MNKKGLVFKQAFLALIALSIMVIATGNWVNEWNNDYNANMDYNLNEYNKLNDLSSEAQSQREAIGIKSASSDSSINFEGTSIRGVFGMLNNIYAPFRMVFGDNGMIDSITERFGMPDFIRQGLVAMMVMVITFTLASIFFRLPRSSA